MNIKPLLKHYWIAPTFSSKNRAGNNHLPKIMLTLFNTSSLKNRKWAHFMKKKNRSHDQQPAILPTSRPLSTHTFPPHNWPWQVWSWRSLVDQLLMLLGPQFCLLDLLLQRKSLQSSLKWPPSTPRVSSPILDRGSAFLSLFSAPYFSFPSSAVTSNTES